MAPPLVVLGSGRGGRASAPAEDRPRRVRLRASAGDLTELANIAAVMGFEEFAATYPEAAPLVPALEAPLVDAAGVLQILPVEVLVAVRRGELDLNALVAAELASRGLDLSGKWVGFERAAALESLLPVRRGDGSVVFVSVPESEGK
jgi:hypothetical protein